MPRALRLLLTLFAAMALLIGAACGDDDSSDLDAAVDDAGDDSSDDDSSDDDSSDSSDDSGEDIDLGDVAFDGNCSEAFEDFADVQTGFADAFGSVGSGEEFDADAFQENLDQLADNAPDEIQSAFEVMAEELGPFYEALSELDLGGENPDPEALQELTELSESVDQEALEAAGQEITAYFEGGCE